MKEILLRGLKSQNLYFREALVYFKVTGLVGPTQRTLLELLSDGIPRTSKQLVEKSGLTDKAVVNCLHRLWKAEAILRTEKPTYDPIQVFKGRAGIKKNTRAYHRYIYKPEEELFHTNGLRFVKYQKQYLDKRGSGKSKAQLIRNFLRDNSNRAFFSTEIARKLKDEDIMQQDVMSAVRRAERKRLVYVRGYRTDNWQSPLQLAQLCPLAGIVSHFRQKLASSFLFLFLALRLIHQSRKSTFCFSQIFKRFSYENIYATSLL